MSFSIKKKYLYPIIYKEISHYQNDEVTISVLSRDMGVNSEVLNNTNTMEYYGCLNFKGEITNNSNKNIVFNRFLWTCKTLTLGSSSNGILSYNFPIYCDYLDKAIELRLNESKIFDISVAMRLF